MRHIAIVGTAALALAGCGPSTSRELFTAGQTSEISVPANYQEVYRRVSIHARDCLQQENILGGARWTIDAQLYNELGYGEVTYALSQLSQTYLAAAKITRDGAGAKVAIASSSQRWSRAFAGWASGSTDCG